VAELRLSIQSDRDIIQVRQRGKEMAAEAGCSAGDQTVIAVAISEIARNIINYAKRGEIIITIVSTADRRGIVVEARDAGPGIADVSRALQDGYSTSGGLGLGLPGARRLMDEFEIHSALGEGTTVIMKKWCRSHV
jgi:serine/threonine-protein kinase RsbT